MFNGVFFLLPLLSLRRRYESKEGEKCHYNLLCKDARGSTVVASFEPRTRDGKVYAREIYDQTHQPHSRPPNVSQVFSAGLALV